MICDECETVAHCMKNGCVPKTTKKDEALKLALEALETERDNYQDWDKEDGAPEYIYEAITALREALAEQPAQRCPLCNYQHGHAIGCKNNPVDIALNKMAENARELGLDYKPAQQEPVAWKHDCAALLTNDVELWIDHCPHCGKPRTSPPAQRTWVGLEKSDMPDGADPLFDDPKFIAGMVYAANKLMEKNT